MIAKVLNAYHEPQKIDSLCPYREVVDLEIDGEERVVDMVHLPHDLAWWRFRRGHTVEVEGI